MVKRTTINLDSELVAQAREALQARNTTDTVHAALREVVRRDRLRRLAEWDFGGMTLDDLREMRRPRTETREWGKWGDDGLDILRSLRASRKTKPSAKQAKPSAKAKPSTGGRAAKRGHAAAG
jgi:Arc/MetJ family transcription regulator